MECPTCGGDYERLTSHWSHPNTDCDYPDPDRQQQTAVNGLVLAGATVAGNGQHRHVEIGTANEVLARWTADRLGWLCQSVRTEASTGGGSVYIVRTVSHPSLDRYDRWNTLSQSSGREPPRRFNLHRPAARAWWAHAGGIEWTGIYDSQRRGVFSATYDDRASWIRRVLERAGFETRRNDRRVVLPAGVLTDYLDWIGDAVPGVEYKWADTRIDYRALREFPTTEMEYGAAVARNALVIARERTDRQLTPEAFESVVDFVSADFVADVLGGGDWDSALVTAGVKHRYKPADPRGPYTLRMQFRDDAQSPEAYVREAAAACGEPLTKDDYLDWRESVGAPHFDTLLYHSDFNTWTELCNASGVEVARRRSSWRDRFDESDVGNILRTAAKECGEPLSVGTYQQWAKENDYPSPPVLLEWYDADGWPELCANYGVETPTSTSSREYSDERLLRLGKWVVQETGGQPSQPEWIELATQYDGLPSHQTMRKHLGDGRWKDVWDTVEAADVEPASPRG